MRTIKKQLQESEIKSVLDNFVNTFESEFKDDLFVSEPKTSEEGFAALNDFYSEFAVEVRDREGSLQERLNKGVITHDEFDELEAIAVVKYPEIKFDEIADFYRFSYNEGEKIRTFKNYSINKVADLY